MRWLVLLAGCTAFSPSMAPPLPAQLPEKTPWPAAEAIRAATTRPSFAEARFVVADYGARGDGAHDDTAAFQAAIAACNHAGGGHVIVPAGVYLVGALRLLSHVDLHLEADATLRFSGDAGAYPTVLTRYEGIECMNHSPMIYAYGETDIAVTGEGTLDASRTGSWNHGSDRAGVLEPLVSLPPSQREVTGKLRVAFVEPYRSTNVLIQGVTLVGARFWQLHPVLSSNVTIEDVTTRSAEVGTDGLDIESSDHVVVQRSSFGSGDDDIAIKSGRDEDGRRVNVPSRDIVIWSCQGETPYAFLAVGSEETGGVENVYAYHLWTYGQGAGAALRIKANSQRGGYTRNFFVEDLQSGDLHDAVVDVDLEFAGQTGDHPPEVSGLGLSGLSIARAPVVLQVRRAANDALGPITISDSQFDGITDSRRDPSATWSNVTIR